MTSPGELSPDERFARLRLARTDRIGPVTFQQLLQRFGSAQAALDDLPRLGTRAPTLADPTAIATELRAGEALGARLLLWGDPDYPASLAQLDVPPPVLWVRGDMALLHSRGLAIVGARIASAGGQRIARGLASQAGQAGYAIISGMARGIDAAAHEGALPTGTIAVLGGGVDDIYPPQNTDLYHQLIAQGCIVSESPMGSRAQARDFPRRNRIISGLSCGVVVVEAELRSGSLITARLAAEQGREVLAVPGSPLDPRSRGPNQLIRQGATLCEGIEDIEQALAPLSSRLHEPVPSHPFEATIGDVSGDTLERVACLLSAVPTPRDELARAAGLPISICAAALLELSLTGRATLLPGGLVSV